MLNVSDNRKIGVGLTLFGSLFLLLGVLLLFDTALLILGNILFLSGIVVIIGIQKTFVFFARKDRIRGTICLLLGIVLVLVGWPVIGMLIEIFGIINLFGNFFPIVITFLRQMPIIGRILDAPIVSNCLRRLQGKSILPSSHQV